MSRYRVYHVLMDMTESNEGDFEDFRRDLDRLEIYPGVHMLGTEDTDSWPSVRVSESRRAAAPEPARPSTPNQEET